MSAAAGGEHAHEIIIVKHRHGDHDDGHHGGAWKIAFADFMTAMMCFFLVMWLINAANEQTKAAVASYFNPVKLIDRNSSKKGLEDLGDGPNSSGATADKQPEKAESGDSGKGSTGQASQPSASQAEATENHSDEKLFANPFAVLSEIASETGKLQNVSAKGEGGAQLSGPSTGASGGEAYRDPFAPDFWSQQVAAADTAEAGEASRSEGEGGPAGHEEPASAAVKLRQLRQAAGSTGEHEEKSKVDAEAKPSAAAVKAAEAIKKELEQAFGPNEEFPRGLTIVATDKGVTVSITDQLEFGMYEIGSAVPRRQMVLAMEKIGKALNGQPGDIAVGGHTDGRPFRSRHYDNWRLSTARAHSAYYMLLRGGIDEKRVTEVAGHADRRLKDEADPLAAANRRIEILLEIGR